MKPINIPGLENYQITDDGQVFSNILNRWLKPTLNNCGYYMYSLHNTVLNKCKFHMVSRLVAFTYIGEPPTPKHEVNHIDHNRMNNHYLNLEWLTHSENILKAYEGGFRSSYWLGMHKPSPSLETRRLMKVSKEKKVKAYYDGVFLGKYNSVEECCKALGIYRRFFNRVMNGSKGNKTGRYHFELV